jgi:transcriptional regulator with XRE-family HTH domain
MEAGRRRVTADELKKLSEIYGVSVLWLLGENDDADPSVELAARKLAKLDKKDLETVLQLLRTLRKAQK